ncbi:MAG: phosphoesterase [Flavobacteriales bacterium]|nr:phosphoesterase [Flavobacteriales bacterium]
MKILFLLLFLFLIDYYFFLGTISVFSKNTYAHNFYKYFFWILSIFVYFSITYLIFSSRNIEDYNFNNNNIIFSTIFFIFFGAKAIGSFPLILDDIFRFFKITINLFSKSNLDLSRLVFLKKSALFISATVVSSMLLGIKFGRFNFKKYYSNIFIKNWNYDYKIIHISDLHLGSFKSKDKLRKLVSLINNENADLLLFTGDLVNNHYKEVIPFKSILKDLKAKDGKFSVLGNHDYGDYTGLKRSSKEWKDNFNNMIKVQEEIGFDLLLNESRLIDKDQFKFNLVGVENWGAGNFNKDGDIDLAMKNVDDSLPTILLSHDPSHWRSVILKSKYKIDLQLSGHTHGLQFGVELKGFKWSPVRLRYKEWAGLYSSSKKQIYVNRGVGHLGYAGRIGIMPDISVLKIKNGTT